MGFAVGALVVAAVLAVFARGVIRLRAMAKDVGSTSAISAAGYDGGLVMGDTGIASHDGHCHDEHDSDCGSHH
jgi:hypothetical protein